jgi:thioredoxin-related protein
MNCRHLLLVALPVLLLLSACTGNDSAFEESNISHGQDIEEGLALAKKEKKVVMLDFSTKWCGYCRKLEAETLRNPHVQKFLGKHVVVVDVDGDEQRHLVQKFGVRDLYPTLVFLDANNEELGRIVGYLPPAQFLERATRISKGS